MPTKTIDKNVVEMQFDNSQFEKETKKTMSTIDKLKEKLNFSGATKGLDEIEKASGKINFNGMQTGINNLSLSFSALDVIAMRALQNITDRAVEFGINFAKSVSIDQIAAGWEKMDLMTGSVQTLVNSTGKSVDEINGYLDKLMWFSDETSFSFTDMTSALATMTASGGDIEKLIPMIEGIANATAYAGKGAAEFSRVIYNLNQSYSGGALTLMDWKSVALAGVNSKALMETLIKTAEEMGKIKKDTITTANFTETLKDKWADTEVMEKAFGTFSAMTEEAYKLVEAGKFDTASAAYEFLSGQFDEIAERAAKSAQEAKTFKEAIASVKDAVSSKWTNIFTTMFGSYDEAKQTWTNLANDLWEIFAGPLDNLNALLGKTFNSKWKTFGSTLEELGVDVTDLDGKFTKFIKGHLSDNYNGLESWSDHVDNLIEKYGSLEALLESGEIDSSSYLSRFLDELDAGSKSVGTFENKLESLQKIFDDVWSGSLGNGEERIKKLTEAGLDYNTVQKQFIDVLAKQGHKSGYKLVAEDIEYLSEEQLINLGLTKEESKEFKSLAQAAKEAGVPLEQMINDIGKKSGRQLLSETISNLTKTIINLKNTIGTAFSKVFNSGKIANGFYTVINAVNKFTEKIVQLTTESKFLESIFTTLFSAIKFFNSIIDQVVGGVGSLISKVFNKLNISIGGVTSKIADYLATFVNWVTENNIIFTALDNVGDIIVGLIDTLKEWFSELQKSEFATKVINAFKDALVGLGNALKGIDIKNFSFKDIKKDFTGFLETVKSAPEDIFKNIGTNIGGIFTGIFDQVKDIPNKIGNSFKGISDSFSDISENGQKIHDFFSGLIETLVGVGGGVAIFTILNKVADGLIAITKPITALKDLPGAIKGTFDSITGYFNAMKNNIQTNNIIKLAGAISALVLAFYLLVKLGDPKALVISVAAIGTLVIILSKVTKDMNNVNLPNGNGLEKTIGILLSLAGSLILISIAVNALKGLKPEEMSTGIGSVIVLLAAMTGAMVVLSKFAKDPTGVAAKQVIAFAASLLIMALAMKSLAKLADDPNKWGVALVGIITCVTLLAGLAIVMSKFKVDAKAGLNLILFAASILLICLGIKKLVEIPVETYYTGLLRIALILGAFTLVGVALKGAQTSVMGLGAVILAISSAMVSLTFAIKMMKNIEFGDLLKAGLILSGLMIVLAIASSLMSFFGNGAKFSSMAGLGLVIFSISASMFLLVAAIMILKNLDEEGIWRAVKVLSVLMLVVGLSVGLMNLTKMFDASGAMQGAKVLTSFAIVIGVLAAALFVLSSLDQTKLLASAGALTAVMLSLALLVAAISLIADNLLKTLGAVGIVALLLGSLVGVFYLLSKIEWDDTMQTKVEAMAALIAELGIVAIALSVAGALAGLAGPGIAIILAALIGLEAIVLATIGIASLISPEVVDKATIVLNKIGEAIGGFFGGIVSNFLSSATSTLPTVGESLSKFMESMEGFFTSLSNISGLGTNMDVFGDTIEVVKQFGSLDTQNSLKRITNNSGYLEKVKDFFDKYSKIVVSFSQAISGKINASAVQAAANAGMMMADVNNSIPSSGWLSTIFTGEKSLKDFGKQMEDYATSIVNVSKILSAKGAFNENAISIAESAGKTMVTLANSLPDGGIKSWWNGKHDLGDFGTQIESYAQSLVNLCTIIAKANIKTGEDGPVAIAETLGSTLAELSASLPQQDSIKGALLGGNNTDLAEFGTKITSFATALVEMCNAISAGTFTDDTVEKAGIAGESLKTLIEHLPEDSGIEEGISNIGIKIQEGINSMMNTVIEKFDRYKDASSSGKNTLKGLLAGLKDPTLLAQIYAAGQVAGRQFMAGYDSEVDVNSPSEEMRKRGMFTIRGLVIGLNENIHYVKEASEKTAEAMLDPITQAIELASGMDDNLTSPVIKPVLDLSEIQNGANNIGGILNNGYMMSVGSLNPNIINPNMIAANNQAPMNNTINIDFQIDNSGKDITNSDIEQWSDMLVDSINNKLGLQV